jgi:prepilin-type N-terminal cleavage/methylation domain-containing protein
MRSLRSMLCALKKKGFSLVELLVALALMGFVSLSITNFLVKSNVTSSSLSARFKEANEIHAWVAEVREDLQKGAFISTNSHKERLEYTTYDNNGSALKKIYQIYTDGTTGKKHMRLSLDGGTTWQSPYKISGTTKYSLSGSPRFIYLDHNNLCTIHTDNNGNGVLGGGDSYGYSICASSSWSYGWGVRAPTMAVRLILDNFVFTTGTGSPEAIRALPAQIFIKINPGLVRSYAAGVSPAVEDPIKDYEILTNSASVTTNSFFTTTFDPRCAKWDPSRDRLITVGNYTAGGSTKIYVTDRMGILINKPISVSPTTLQLTSVDLEGDGNKVIALDSSLRRVYKFNLTGSQPLTASSTLDLASPSVLVNQPAAIAYDASTPNDVYVLGIDPSNSAVWKIWEINFSTRAIVTSWTLPGAFNGTTNPAGGLTIEPITGDFLVTRNFVSSSAIDLYRIKRSDGTTYSGYPMSISLTKLGSSATSTFGNWGISYNAMENRIFLADSVADKIYEVVPDRLISPVN